MATNPMPNPQASAPQPGGGGDASQGQQANPLQTTLGKVAMLLKQVAGQNPSVQEDLNNAVNSLVQAIQKSSQAAPSAPQQSPAPPQQ
jgi:hypothetical protein